MALPDRCTLILTVGGHAASPIERTIRASHHAIALDTIEKCAGADWCERVVVLTDSPDFAARLRDHPVVVEQDAGRFHFGEALADVIRRHRIGRAFYVGGGSAALLSADGFAEFAHAAIASDDVLVPNNFFSSDFVAFAPASAIERIAPPANDNGLALALQREAGLTNITLNRTVGSQFDVDTPTDLLILTDHPRAGRHTAAYLAAQGFDTARVRAIGRFFTQPGARVTIAGRVGTWLLALLQKEIACRTRIFAEERGMRAEGRETGGVARTLLGYHLEAVGADQLMRELAELGDALVLDTRPLYAHLRLDPPAGDRFNSDLLAAELIEDPRLRAFVEAVRAAPLPVLLGGHSVVAGGLWALIESAWLENDELVAATGAP